MPKGSGLSVNLGKEFEMILGIGCGNRKGLLICVKVMLCAPTFKKVASSVQGVLLPCQWNIDSWRARTSL